MSNKRKPGNQGIPRGTYNTPKRATITISIRVYTANEWAIRTAIAEIKQKLDK